MANGLLFLRDEASQLWEQLHEDSSFFELWVIGRYALRLTRFLTESLMGGSRWTDERMGQGTRGQPEVQSRLCD